MSAFKLDKYSNNKKVSYKNEITGTLANYMVSRVNIKTLSPVTAGNWKLRMCTFVGTKHNFLVITNLTHFFIDFSNYQLNAQFLYSSTICMLHYDPQHVSSSTLLILRRTNCITTASGIVTLCKQPYSMPVESSLSTCIKLVIWKNLYYDARSEKHQIMHFFHVFIYFMSLHVSIVTALIIRRSNCINTSSGMISLCDCFFGSGPAYQAVNGSL